MLVGGSTGGSHPDVQWQRILFWMPYMGIGLTGIGLVALPPSDPALSAPRLVGLLNLALLISYFAGLLGNHYLKFYSIFVNVFGLLLFSILHELEGIMLLLSVFFVPGITFVCYCFKVPSISEIQPRRLYLSNRSAAISVKVIERNVITHILDLTGESRHPASKNVQVKRVRVTDRLGSQGSLAAVSEEAFQFVKQAHERGGRVLVHCRAGQSRSAAFVVQYLMTTAGMRLSDAESYVRKRRPVIDISSDHMAPIRALDLQISNSNKAI